MGMLFAYVEVNKYSYEMKYTLVYDSADTAMDEEHISGVLKRT